MQAVFTIYEILANTITRIVLIIKKMPITKKYLRSQGKLLTRNAHRSITIQFDSKSKLNRIRRKLKYQSKWTAYSTGYWLRLNFDTI